jgi:hypothetical protein
VAGRLTDGAQVAAPNCEFLKRNAATPKGRVQTVIIEDGRRQLQARVGLRDQRTRPSSPCLSAAAAASATSSMTPIAVRTPRKNRHRSGRGCVGPGSLLGWLGGGGGVSAATAVGGRRVGGTSEAFSWVCRGDSCSSSGVGIDAGRLRFRGSSSSLICKRVLGSALRRLSLRIVPFTEKVQSHIGLRSHYPQVMGLRGHVK